PGVEQGNYPIKEVAVLIALAVILLILAVLGGIAVHPLLFALAIIALLLLFGGRRGTTVPRRRGTAL
ncbi:MAG: hypothetical protein QOJ46_2097, partial [bacterium]